MEYAKSKPKAYTKFILRLLAGSSFLYVSGLFNPASSKRIIKVFQRFTKAELSQLRRAVRNLEKRRVLTIVEKGQDAEIRLTPQGQNEAERLRLRDLTISTPPQWDRRWRLVLFDIPEYLRTGRDTLRHTLNRLGFYQIQKSVFVHPFPCEREISAIAEVFAFEKYVHCFTVEIMKPSYHEQLMRHFGLHGKFGKP